VDRRGVDGGRALGFGFDSGLPRPTQDGLSSVHLDPRRLGASLDAIRIVQHGESYRVMRVLKDNTFEDAVILMSDDPAEPPELRSIVWCAYYLYPRVLVHESGLRAHPGLEADFVVTTPHFVAGLPESVAAPKLDLLPLSARAREYATRRTP